MARSVTFASCGSREMINLTLSPFSKVEVSVPRQSYNLFAQVIAADFDLP